MSSALRSGCGLNRGDVFGPLVALAKARTVASLESGALAPDDGLFLLRALLDLEADGADLFDATMQVDTAFYGQVESYLAARIGAALARPVMLEAARAELYAALVACEEPRVAELLALPGSSRTMEVDHAVERILNDATVNHADVERR